MDPLFQIIEDLAALSEDELREFIAGSQEVARAVAESPADYVGDGRTAAQLLDEVKAGVAAIAAARAELASREAPSVGDVAGELGELATLAAADEDPEEEPDETDEPESAAVEAPAVAAVEEPEVAAVEDPQVEEPAGPVTAAARRPLPKPGTRHQPVEHRAPRVALTAAAAGYGYAIGDELPGDHELAQMLIAARRNFGQNIPEGLRGEKWPVARANWQGLYPAERILDRDEDKNMALIAAATDPEAIKAEMRRRRAETAKGNSLVASGGLCAPVTPYYQLQMVASAVRPVRASLPSFAADRGGIRFARPATIASVTTGVGIRTATNDFDGGTAAAKTCQVIACPPFSEVDVDIVFRCLQFGNLGARAFPELVAQWNQLTLAAHARTAESNLLTHINTASTAVTASSLNTGASSDLLGQILAAANGMRSRHRMDPEAVLRLMMPDWAIDLMISDVIRSQFQRFDTDEARLIALLRSFDVEPTFYIDGASGASQVFGTQAAGALTSFPATVRWYLFPEGSFLYLDGGTLELGLVRDSVLNASNDFQLFGETFENVAFVGVESLAVTSTTCDRGAVSAPVAVTGCGAY